MKEKDLKEITNKLMYNINLSMDNDKAPYTEVILTKEKILIGLNFNYSSELGCSFQIFANTSEEIKESLEYYIEDFITNALEEEESDEFFDYVMEKQISNTEAEEIFLKHLDFFKQKFFKVTSLF